MHKRGVSKGSAPPGASIGVEHLCIAPSTGLWRKVGINPCSGFKHAELCTLTRNYPDSFSTKKKNKTKNREKKLLKINAFEHVPNWFLQVQ